MLLGRRGLTKYDATGCNVQDQQDNPGPEFKLVAAILHVTLAVALADKLVEQSSIPAGQDLIF